MSETPRDAYREIPLTRGKVALVDEADFELASSKNWHANYCSKGRRWYAIDRHSLGLHRFLLDAPDGVTVDHLNGNGLDCRRDNLRIATHSQNLANRGKQRNNTSGYKGVFKRGERSWAARSNDRARKKWIWLGTFRTAEEAARAYDLYAYSRWGKFAKLNFPVSTTIRGSKD